MATPKIHVVPHNEGWAVKVAGESDPASVRSTKKEALNAGKTLALVEEAAVVVHRQDGAFDTVIGFRQVQEEAQQSHAKPAETVGTTPRVRPNPSRYAEPLRGGKREASRPGWSALLIRGAAFLVMALSVKRLFQSGAVTGRAED